jgi:hypothetical protein
MRSFIKLTSGLFIASLLITGCGLLGGNNANNQSDEQTVVADTVVALQTALSANNNAMTLAAPTAPAATQAVLPTFTAASLPQPTTPVYTAPTATSQPAYLITDVEDVTVPDNTDFKPGETFTKTWRLTNGGEATWGADFKLVYISGDQMGASSVTLGRSVAPNNSIDVSVNLTAPGKEGTYQGNFMIQTNSGLNFGIGAGSTSTFWVKIIVKNVFQVTSATVNASPTTFTGTCPGTISLTASITSAAAGTVTYYFVTSTGNSSTYSITFTSAGTSTTDAISWPVNDKTGSLIVHVYVDTPNHQDFPNITIPVQCK